MVFPLVYLLYFYYAFVAVWLIFSLVAIYHLMKFGLANFLTYAISMGYLVISILIFSTSFYYINQIDWDVNASIFGLLVNNIFI